MSKPQSQLVSKMRRDDKWAKAQLVNQVLDRARRGLSEAKIRRKYTPPGPYAPVEALAMKALLEIVKLCEHGKN